MTIETKSTLSKEALDDIQDLIKINVDSRDTFHELADHTENSAVAIMFRELASERNRNVAELESLINFNDKTPDESGTAAAIYHRVVINLRAVLGAGTTTMLEEAESAEDKIKHRYEEILKRNPGSAVSDVLHRQYAGVKAAHDRVRAIRDAHRRAT